MSIHIVRDTITGVLRPDQFPSGTTLIDNQGDIIVFSDDAIFVISTRPEQEPVERMHDKLGECYGPFHPVDLHITVARR